jgi:hypothetical protein
MENKKCACGLHWEHTGRHAPRGEDRYNALVAPPEINPDEKVDREPVYYGNVERELN